MKRRRIVLKGDSLDVLSQHDSAAIRLIETTPHGLRVDLHDKLVALKALAKHLQL